MDDRLEKISEVIKASANLKLSLLEDEELLSVISRVASMVATTFERDKKVFFCGNGGSAADSQHLAAEFSGRFYFDRPPLFSEALHVNTSYLTAVANDYDYDEIYARLIQAKGRKGDILFGLSTSGNSRNIVRAFEQAKENGVIVVAMTGKGGGEMKKNADYLIEIPSTDTPRIQEAHMLLGHIICEMVEEQLFERGV